VPVAIIGSGGREPARSLLREELPKTRLTLVGSDRVDCCGIDLAQSLAYAINPLPRTVTGNGDAVHDATLAMVVVDRIMLHGSVVPERNRAALPMEAACKFGLHLMVE
jgi:hypothetical protein